MGYFNCFSKETKCYTINKKENDIEKQKKKRKKKNKRGKTKEKRTMCVCAYVAVLR